MSRYICKHGYMFVECNLCVAVDEAIEDFMMRPIPVESDDMAEMMYDHYLDADEAYLRESEEL